MSAHKRDVNELHKSMLKAQRDGGDFDLTFRELCQIWRVKSTDTVRYHINHLAECGLVRTRVSGKRYRVYRAVEKGKV